MSILPPPTDAANSARPTAAVLFVDETGVVRAANSSAAKLWGVDAANLCGEAFVRLFAFEIVSDDSDWLETQWLALRDSAIDRDTRLDAKLHDGSISQVVVRLEQTAGMEDRLTATVLPPTVAAPAPTANSDSAALLAAPGGLAFFDLNPLTGAARYSPAWKKTLGFVEAELSNTYGTWLDLIHPEDSAAAPDQIGRRMNQGTHPFDVEFRMKHRRGHFVWIHCLGLLIINAAGLVERVAGIIIDITERKEIEDASLANDERLQQLSDGGPLAAFELDFGNQRFWYSPAWNELMGFDSADDQPGTEQFRATIPAAEAGAGLEGWWLSRQPGHGSWCEVVKLQRRDGSPVTLLLGAQRHLSRKHDLNRVTGFLCALPDDLGAAAVTSSLAPQLVEDTLNTLAEAVLVSDVHGKVSYLNANAARLLRLPPDQAMGRPVNEVMRLLDRQSGMPGDDVCERALAAEGDIPLCNDHALDHGDGATPQPIVWTARVSYGPSGAAQGVVAVFRDPDEMSLTPEELLKANRFETLGLLAGGIAHDFNNLLSTILGGISLAKDNRDDSALADSEKACLNAKGLTKQLLAAAKGGTGAMVVITATEIVHDAVKIAGAGSDAKIEIDVPEDTWPVLVDRSQILQVFQNLIVNAVQAMPPPPHRGLVQISARNVTLKEAEFPPLVAGDYIKFNVIDNAAGIKPENLEHIFDPFFTTKKHGTGLGLATVLSVVRKHGGEIGVGSTVGEGTTFSVFLPQANKPAEVQARRAPTLRFGTGRVLFMDDDEKICALTSTMLQSLDYKFDVARNGEEAIKFYQRYLNIGRPYDAVIMDITVVGGMGGEECFHALHALDSDVRAIVSSGYDNEEMAERFLAMGFCGYLTKPYRVTDLGKVLKAVLG
ncbi:MAG: PAS domain-containing protein [Cephaloticoccus sp.]|nr:PAS domain-containing protein [Cephaloticoccus sp.]MCF7761300.1 PAS domain-containing protein [Cephaloticoccus sp.]